MVRSPPRPRRSRAGSRRLLLRATALLATSSQGSSSAFVAPPRSRRARGALASSGPLSSPPPTAPGGEALATNGWRDRRAAAAARGGGGALRSRVGGEVEATESATAPVADGGGTNGSGANGSRPNGVEGTNGSDGAEAEIASADAFAPEAPAEGGFLSQLKESLFLGIEPTPEIVAIMTIYFVEGALGLARLAQTFLLKDTLHLGPAEMSALSGAFALPWTIKPLYGFLSDGFPLFGYRRRSYLVLAGLLGCLCYTALGADFWGLLSDPAEVTGAVDAVQSVVSSVGGVAGTAASTATEAATAAATIAGSAAPAALSRTDLQWTAAALLLSSACIAISDVVADGIVVQRTRDSNDPRVAGGLQSLCWGSAAIGGLITAYFSGSLLEMMGPREVFAITAVLPFLVAAIATLIDEKPVEAASKSEEGNAMAGVKQQIDGLWSAIKEPAIWKPALFLFLWQSTPTSEGAMLYFMTNDLGFGPEFLGRVRLVTAVSSLFGVWVYQKYLRTVPIKDILFWASIASTPLGLSQLLLISHANRALGIPDGAFVFGDDVALSILGELAFLPTLVLAARLCPPGVEAVMFATLMSVKNGASTVGTELGAGITKYLGVTESNFDNLGLLTILCNVSSLYPLLFIGWLDGVGSKSEEEVEGSEGEAGKTILDVAAPPDTKGES